MSETPPFSPPGPGPGRNDGGSSGDGGGDGAGTPGSLPPGSGTALPAEGTPQPPAALSPGEPPAGSGAPRDTAAAQGAAGDPADVDPLADVPDDIREAARLAPDHWLGIVDPAWRGEGAPPAWAVVGEYRSGLDGDVVEWRDNDDYRPSPVTLGWPEPTDVIDEAVQFASTGYGSEDDVIALLAGAEVAVLVDPEGRPLAARTPDGDPVVPVFTSDVHLQSVGQLASDIMPMTSLVPQLPEGHRVYINPTGAVCMVVDTDTLNSAIGAAAQEPGAEVPGAEPEPGAGAGSQPAAVPGPASPPR
jgi:hypothetical protein